MVAASVEYRWVVDRGSMVIGWWELLWLGMDGSLTLAATLVGWASGGN